MKVCTRHEWSTYFKEKDYDKLKEAMKNKEIIELHNLFDSLEVVDGAMIEVMHISTVRSRAAYERFEKMMTDEEKEAKEKEPWE